MTERQPLSESDRDKLHIEAAVWDEVQALGIQEVTEIARQRRQAILKQLGMIANKQPRSMWDRRGDD